MDNKSLRNLVCNMSNLLVRREMERDDYHNSMLTLERRLKRVTNEYHVVHKALQEKKGLEADAREKIDSLSRMLGQANASADAAQRMAAQYGGTLDRVAKERDALKLENSSSRDRYESLIRTIRTAHDELRRERDAFMTERDELLLERDSLIRRLQGGKG